jgi:hypothetical protein
LDNFDRNAKAVKTVAKAYCTVASFSRYAEKWVNRSCREKERPGFRHEDARKEDIQRQEYKRETGEQGLPFTKVQRHKPIVVHDRAKGKQNGHDPSHPIPDTPDDVEQRGEKRGNLQLQLDDGAACAEAVHLRSEEVKVTSVEVSGDGCGIRLSPAVMVQERVGDVVESQREGDH